MCLEPLRTYQKCSYKHYQYKPCTGFLKEAPDDGFEGRKRMFCETCKKKCGKREEKKAGTCENVGCKGLRDSNAREEGVSEAGSGKSAEG
jgi:hypothetical protein